MPLASIKLPPRSGRALRVVVAAWRRLTGGERTLVACSGGGDSCGLVLALAAGLSRPAQRLVVGHVVHDLRPAAEAEADRAAAAELAGLLGLPFAWASVRVREAGGNLEGSARRLRYAALADLAETHDCPFVASAHHAGDQLETVLMGLLRGAGPAGLAGAARHRRLGLGRVTLVRPALTVAGSELRELCSKAGWAWREDATNADRTRRRAAIRHGIVPELEGIAPAAAERASRSASLLADAAGLVGDHVRRLLALAETVEGEPDRPRALAWDRASLGRERRIVLGALVREAAARLRGGAGRDRLGLKTLDPLLRAVRSRGTDPKRFLLHGLEANLDAHRLVIRRRDA